MDAMEKLSKQQLSNAPWQLIAGLAFLWPCLQSSGFYPLSLVAKVDRFDPAFIAGLHLLYSIALIALFALAFFISKRIATLSQHNKIACAAIALVGASGLAALSIPNILVASAAATYAAMLGIAVFTAYFTVFWGTAFSNTDAGTVALHTALSFVLSQAFTLLAYALGFSQNLFLEICALGCGASAIVTRSTVYHGDVHANDETSMKQLPWSIIVFTLLLIYFCVIHVRLQIPQFNGDASVGNKCLAASICLVVFLCVTAFLTKSQPSPHRLTVIFITLVAGYLAGLGAVSLFFSTDGGSLARRVLIADEHCLEAFLWMLLAHQASTKGISGIRIFALYGIAIVVLPWLISFDVRYLTPLGEIAATSDWVLPLVTIALCATAIGALTFLSSYVIRISRNASSSMQQSIQQSAETVLSQAALTPRELEIAAYVYRGYSAKRIAEKLFLSEPTIKSYTSRVYRKLGIKSKQELIDYVDERRPLA